MMAMTGAAVISGGPSALAGVIPCTAVNKSVFVTAFSIGQLAAAICALLCIQSLMSVE